ncbi:MAG: hypothetical protein PVH87_03080 [Desulfobacteraceae bacterium]|jgi:DNA polymerase-3 subunit delta
MSEISHNQLPEFLKKTTAGKPQSCVYLIHGQEMLVEQSAGKLIGALLKGQPQDLYCEKVDGLVENLLDALERLNTFALLSGPKIVLFKDAKLFEGRSHHQQMHDQIIDAWQGDDVHRAAKLFLNWCRLFDVDLDAAHLGSSESEPLKTLMGALGTDGVGKLAQYCRSKGWKPATTTDHSEVLQRALEKGFPPDHFLVVTVNSRVPKNLKLYKAFQTNGVVIDCNIPLGERRSDKMAQEAVLRDSLDELMAKAKKRLSPAAFQSLCRLTGFDPRTFVQNVQKLIDYTGDRLEITEEDIQIVLRRTKADPIFELTNAVADRDIGQTLFYLNALLDSKWHPLQILSALANQMRKLLVAKSFTASKYGSKWARGMTYPQFQKSVLSAAIDFDNHSREQTAAWHDAPTQNRKKGRVKKKEIQDIALAANPKSPYPVYQTLVKSDNYTMEELVQSLGLLNRADLRLKSTGQDPAMVVRKTIMEICTKTEGRHS